MTVYNILAEINRIIIGRLYKIIVRFLPLCGVEILPFLNLTCYEWNFLGRLSETSELVWILYSQDIQTWWFGFVKKMSKL